MPTTDDVRRVVAATDRSDGGDRAVRWAAGLARSHGADLLVVRVHLAGSDGDPDAEADMVALARFAHEVGGDRARARTVHAADPAAAIVAAASEAAADVLVIGNSGMRGRREFLLGNVANRVSHAASCTTVIVQSTDAGIVAIEPDHAAAPRRTARAAEILGVLRRHRVHEALAGTGGLDGDARREAASRLRHALEELGPTFAKLGQILSTRPDLVPAEYVVELAHLQSDVPPMPEAEVVAVMERELGVPWEDVFADITPEPLAAGTIGQVHRARLADGTRVVVKVQRPAAAEAIHRDLALMATVVRGLASSRRVRTVIDVEGLFDQLAASLRAELDFTREARNLERMHATLVGFPSLGVPGCHRELTTERLLVMDEVLGVPVERAPAGPARDEAARQLLAACFHQVLAAGFFHADPHPGNLLWADDRIWLIDLGMVGELDDETRRRLMLLLLAFWQGDVAFLTDLTLGFAPEGRLASVDVAAYEASLGDLVASVRGASLRDLELGPLLQQVTEISVRHGVPVPAPLAMVGKALSQVQQTVTRLAPDLDPLEEAGRFFVRDVTRRLAERADPSKLLYETEKLRYRITSIADALATAGGARPGRRLEVGFASDQLETTVRRAGRTVAFGFAGGLALLGAAVAGASERTPRWVPAALAAVGGGLTAGVVAGSARDRRPGGGAPVAAGRSGR